jgi:pyruvate formate lyase activating enzyme
MEENSIDFETFDIKAEGKDAFAQFYRANRSDVYRDKDGIDFPVFTNGSIIRQGVSVVVSYLLAEDKLDGYISRSILHGEWIDGFDISGGDPEQADLLIEVLQFLKKSGLKIQLTTNGQNSSVLEKVLNKNLGDRLIMEVKGPASLYQGLIGKDIDAYDISQSIGLATKFPEYSFHTAVAPVMRTDGTVSYLTPEEIAETAKMIEEASGSKKHPYRLKALDLQEVKDEQLKSADPLAESEMFKYRTAARRYQVMTEIDK